LLLYSSKPSLGVPNGLVIHHINLAPAATIFWRRCQGTKKKKLPHQLQAPTSTPRQQQFSFMAIPRLAYPQHKIWGLMGRMEIDNNIALDDNMVGTKPWTHGRRSIRRLKDAIASG
jgi:hypothetical protein